MFAKLKKGRLVGASAMMVVLGAMVLASSASARTGDYAVFNYCPSTTSGVQGCLYSKVYGGEVILGKKKVPVVNPVVLQGGVGVADPNTGNEKFYAATNGVTLSKAQQPVPGGLSGLVNCKEINPILFLPLRLACEAALENPVSGAWATVELAKPASEITINEGNLIFQGGVGLTLPVKIHLENPFLGSSCYIGSSSSPILWKLTTGKTSPPSPNKSISGSAGKAEVKGDDEAILRLNGLTLVDNAWSAPGATGCGGPVAEAVLNPIVNNVVGVPSAAGKNTVILKTDSYVAETTFVNKH